MSPEMTQTDHRGEPQNSGPTTPVLQVSDLSVDFVTSQRQVVPAVRNLSLSVGPSDVLAIVGESGSGKSVSAMAMFQLLPAYARVSGSVKLEGEELLTLSPKRLRAIRGNRVALVPQDPLGSLTPVLSVGAQLVEAIRTHQSVSKKDAQAHAIGLLDSVGLAGASRRIHSYPHEFSGGMRQRVVIAMAMANDPVLIVADEPTTALDVTVQAEVMRTLELARERTGAALVLISHDLGLVSGQADDVCVMYAGRVVEHAPASALFSRPRMPYTSHLISSIPRLGGPKGLTVGVGPTADGALVGTGCDFAPRCEFAQDICQDERPALREVSTSHTSACHFADDLDLRATPSGSFAEGAGAARPSDDAPTGRRRPQRDRVVLTLDSVEKSFRTTDSAGLWPRKRKLRVLKGVDLTLRAGETLGMVGESGCGKSTLVRSIFGLEKIDEGSISYIEPTGDARHPRKGSLGPEIQMVFQDPTSSLDPRMTVEASLAELLRLSGKWTRESVELMRRTLRLVGLPGDSLRKYPHQFSGGERQRIAIARALIVDPDVVVLDEAVSSLDVSIQAQVLILINRLQAELGLSYIFVSHDLAVVSQVADRVVVIYKGRIVESGDVRQIFRSPLHPYTRELVEASLAIDPSRSAREAVAQAPVRTSASEGTSVPESGCAFRFRCHMFNYVLSDSGKQRCVSESPPLRNQQDERHVACHYADVSTSPHPPTGS